MTQRLVDLFIWHAWRPHPARDALDEMLGNSGITFRNFGLAWFDPIYKAGSEEGRAYLIQLLSLQIQPARVVLALPEMCSGDKSRHWLQIELQEAKKQAKPVLVVDRLQDGAIPGWLAEAATATVGWNETDIAAALGTLLA